MDTYDIFGNVLKWCAVFAFIYFITEAAFFFEKPGILWWYFLPAIVATSETEININNKEENDE